MVTSFVTPVAGSFSVTCKVCKTTQLVSKPDIRVRMYRKKSPTYSCRCSVCRNMQIINHKEIPEVILSELNDLF